MKAALVPFPDMPHPEIAITVEVTVEPDTIGLRYRVTGPIGDLLLPEPVSPARRDLLWQHSCFEAFLMPEGGEDYLEFNFAPSRLWAMYGFTGYRRDMRDVTEIAVPRIGWPESGDDFFELHPMIYPPTARPARLGLTAVIEEKSGRKSWWALAHPNSEPDFHNAAGFTLELPAAA